MGLRHASVGVIGHVNHGKTALVKALSGIDTDRLEEEKRRGMSIVLGFAWLALEDGVLDLVDVPGHEQFVRTMVAGATGIQASLLVVSAREGIKPQTVEHVAIADLLGVRRGVVALSQCDLVEEGRRGEVQHALRRLLRGTHLEFAPVVFTSARTGEGLPALRAALATLLRAPEAAPTAAHCWLPVDRVFSLPGHGTVATGTLRGAAVRVGDRLAVLPRGVEATVRQLQVHRQAVEEALPGQRVGVNLRGLPLEALARGDVLLPPGRTQAAALLDVELRLLPDLAPRELDQRRVRLLLGTTEVGATVRVLEEAGGGVLAQLRCAQPVVAIAGESFILRRESPAGTLGGGRVLEPALRRHGRQEDPALQRLRVLAGGSGRQLLCEQLRAAGCAGLAAEAVAASFHVSVAELPQLTHGVALLEDGRLWSLPLVQALQQRIVEALRVFHARQPLRPGAPLASCRGALPAELPERLWQRLLEGLEREHRIERRAGLAWLAGHDPLAALDPPRRAELDALAAAFRSGGMHPPEPPDAAAQPGLRALMDLLVARGELLLLPGQPPSQRIAFHREALCAAEARLAAAFAPPACFTVSQARELLGSTRKYTVPLLQYLHATGQTVRRGDLHAFVRPRPPGGV